MDIVYVCILCIKAWQNNIFTPLVHLEVPKYPSFLPQLYRGNRRWGNYNIFRNKKIQWGHFGEVKFGRKPTFLLRWQLLYTIPKITQIKYQILQLLRKLNATGLESWDLCRQFQNHPRLESGQAWSSL